VREIKEKFCFISGDIQGDRKLDAETTFYNSYYKLPDNRVIKISNEKFEAPEILFNPSLMNSEADGIHEMVFNCINVN
jgi:actin-related protein 2